MRLERQNFAEKETRPVELLPLAPVWKNAVSDRAGHRRQMVRSGQAASEARTLGKQPRSCLTTPLGLEEQEMEMDGGKGASETPAEEDRETARNAATAPSPQTPRFAKSAPLSPLVSTTSQRIPPADWHAGRISSMSRGKFGVLLPD